jgi:HAE1 family hydrophobic/amphiphilic exporter-1
MISKFFIERPVLANVIAILMVVIGAVAVFRLPVAQYPNVVPPTVQVTARYPGASARTVIDTVALPIEQQVNGVEDMLYMQSFATSDGMYALTVTFAIGTDLNAAQVLVQNRVSSAMASLPQSVQAQGVVVQKKSTAILQIITLTSPDNSFDSLYLSNYGTIKLKDEIARLQGVGNVNVFGAGQYAMRVWLDPERMQARNLNAQDVIQALQQQSEQVTAGQLGMPPVPSTQSFQYTIDVVSRFDEPAQFANVVVKTGANGDLTRLRDVGRVELGAQTYGQIFNLDGKQAAGLAIFQTPGANALDVAQRVAEKIQTLSREFPQGMAYSIPFDTTLFVQAAISEVYRTLLEAAVLVLIVILVFLQDWRATLVPATTVPVTIIGAFAAMAALGFSINLSTLFAIVLAIGIVVDDAIVVVEGAAHKIENGLTGHDAAIGAMNELMGPIIGITLVLMAVFLPASFLPGLTGQMYAQFALVIAATALISAINAATLKPTQCALWLRRPVPPEKRNFLYRGFNAVYDRAEHGYRRLIGSMVRHSGAMALIAAAIVGAAIYGMSRAPTGFLPIEDQGYLLAAVQLPDGASLDRTHKTLQQVEQLANAVEGVERVITIAGISVLDNSASLANGGVAYIMLKDWSVRGKGQDLASLYKTVNDKLTNLSDGTILVLPPPPIQGIGNAGGFSLQIELRDGSFDLSKLGSATNAVVAAASTQSGIQRISTSFRASAPQYRVTIDREKVQALLLTTDQVFSTMAAYLGSSYVSQFNKFGRVLQIYVQGDASFRMNPEDVLGLRVRNQNGDMIPLGTVLTIEPSLGPSLISLYNLYPSATVVGVPAKGFSSGDAIALMDEITTHTLPRGVGSSWTALSYQEMLVGGQIYFVFALAMLLVYLVLAGQYESWFAPMTVLFAVPLSLVGPVLVFLLLRIEINLYAQIGLVLLIALSAKNAILIVEVARDLRKAGRPVIESAVEAARARFRPILMTSFTFALGVLPLVLAEGAGASARKSIGITVFTGMLASTCLAVLFVPSLFVVVQKLEEWRSAKKGASKVESPLPG